LRGDEGECGSGIEVGDEGMSGWGDEDVGWDDVLVNDAVLVEEEEAKD
jgi:hypothetical protein